MLIKDKTEEYSDLKSLHEQKSIQVGWSQTEHGLGGSTGRSPGRGFDGEYGSKERKLLIGYSLKPSWLFAAGCP